MELSKTEMEDIWRNKPVGYFKSIKKDLKSTKRYKIKVSPHTYHDLPSETFEVRGYNTSDALMKARTAWYDKFPDQPRPDGWRLNIVV